jgi:N6-adenosine-specific RNA methylase IME4
MTTAPAPFETLRAHHYGAVLVDPPWLYRTYSEKGRDRCPDARPFKGSPARHYDTMPTEDIKALPVASLCADDCVLFLWMTWPLLLDAIAVMMAWDFEYKSCAFDWTKADASQIELFQDDIDRPSLGTGYWTRANSEPACLARAASRSGSMRTCARPSSSRAASTHANRIAFMNASSGWWPGHSSSCSRASNGQAGMFGEMNSTSFRDEGAQASGSSAMNCEKCIPYVNCDFFRTDASDVCSAEARLSACDVADAAHMLRDAEVDLNDRMEIEAVLLAEPELEHIDRAIKSGRWDVFIERAVACARSKQWRGTA